MNQTPPTPSPDLEATIAQLTLKLASFCLFLRGLRMPTGYEDAAVILNTTSKMLKLAIRPIPAELSAFIVERMPSGLGKIKVKKASLQAHREVLLAHDIPLSSQRSIPAQYVLDAESLKQLMEILPHPLTIESRIELETIEVTVYLFDEIIYIKELKAGTQEKLGWRILMMEGCTFEDFAEAVTKLQAKKMWDKDETKKASRARTDFTSLVVPINQAVENALPFLKTKEMTSWRRISTTDTGVRIGELLHMEIETSGRSSLVHKFGHEASSIERSAHDNQNTSTGTRFTNHSIQTEESGEVQSVH